jgi:DNA polymerase
VFSEGKASAKLMLVGEQPGDKEDREGKPFVGPAGRILREALDAANIPLEDVYLTNAVKHFRFEQRGKRRIHQKPELGNIVACHPWLEREVSVVAPETIVCLGATAGRAVLGRTVRVTAERGKPLEDTGLRIVLTSHPSAVIRLKGKSGYDEAFDALVSDLEVAARSR